MKPLTNDDSLLLQTYEKVATELKNKVNVAKVDGTEERGIVYKCPDKTQLTSKHSAHCTVSHRRIPKHLLVRACLWFLEAVDMALL